MKRLYGASSFVIGLTIAQSGFAQDSGIYNACVKTNGNIRIVDTADSCNTKNETAVELRVAGSSDKHLVAVDGNGDAIGLLVNHQGSQLVAATNKGFIIRVNLDDGRYSKYFIYFELPDCMGTAYTDRYDSIGTILGCFGERGCFYTPYGVENPEQVTTQSSLYESAPGTWECNSYSNPQSQTLNPALPSDPAITGFEGPPGGYYTSPISVELR